MNLDKRLIDCSLADLAEVVKIITKAEMAEIATPQAESKYMSSDAVCALFDIAESTLRSYVSKKIIRKYKVGGNIRFKKTEIEAMVQ